MFFGSALNSFGVEAFFDAVIDLAPPPQRLAKDVAPLAAAADSVVGFVFKVQANMDPRHHDRMAFLRVCSGRFRKDMLVYHSRLGRRIRMSRPHRLFAQQRETVEQAFAGDVIGLINPGVFAIGDTLSEEGPLKSVPIPRFAPEHCAILSAPSVIKQKAFQRGLR